jgi:drug/metabolite transporter (DMT)-like permease
VHGALVLTQIIFGCGSVVGKLGVSKFNPVLFALIREGTAGPILLALAFFIERRTIKMADVPMFLIAGFCVFGNQFGFIVGEKLASAVIGSAWQPTQPIFTLVIAIFLGWESATPLKVAGILIAFGGAAFMVFYGQHITVGSSVFAGNILFFINCLGTALYIISTKPLLKKYPPMTVTGYSYIFASIFMFITAMGITTNDAGVNFVCPYDEASKVPPVMVGKFKCSCPAWEVPSNAILPLLYWIVFNSVVAYLILTWGNKYADASKTLAYTALQPLTSTILTVLIIEGVGKDKYPSLKMPGYNVLGAIGIVIGLFCIVGDNSLHAAKDFDDEDEDGNGDYGDMNKPLCDKAGEN